MQKPTEKPLKMMISEQEVKSAGDVMKYMHYTIIGEKQCTLYLPDCFLLTTMIPTIMTMTTQDITSTQTKTTTTGTTHGCACGTGVEEPTGRRNRCTVIQISKVTHCAGCVWPIPGLISWSDQEMGTAISSFFLIPYV